MRSSLPPMQRKSRSAVIQPPATSPVVLASGPSPGAAPLLAFADLRITPPAPVYPRRDRVAVVQRVKTKPDPPKKAVKRKASELDEDDEEPVPSDEEGALDRIDSSGAGSGGDMDHDGSEGSSDDAESDADEPDLSPAAVPASAKRSRKSGWTAAKVEDYKDHLIRRGTRRADGNKPVNNLVRKYVKARKIVEPDFVPHLADAPSAGHHVPSIALGNSKGGAWNWGPRGLAPERALPRVYLRGPPAERESAHWFAHMAETFSGLGSRNAPAFHGTNQDMARTHRRAHRELTDLDKNEVRVDVQSQVSRKAGEDPDLNDVPLEEATAHLMDQRGFGEADFEFGEENTDSDPESDESKWLTDSEDEDE